MVSFRSTIAAGCLTTIVLGSPLPSLRQLFSRSSYVVYGGTGELSQGWPAKSSWASFDAMWTANQGILTSGCGWSPDQLPENSGTEISQIKSAIKSVSSSSGVDARFILAIVIQESNGCVRVHSTDNGVANPGLMQSHRGTGTCNLGSIKQVPCPEANIIQMIEDGTLGTAAGDGLVGVLQKSGASDDSKYFKGARIYNSGSIAASRNIGDGNGATACYSSDVANRLMGFAGNSACDASTVGTLSKTAGYVETAPVEEAAEPTTSAPVAETEETSAPGGVFVEIPSTSSACPSPPACNAPAASATAAPVVEAPASTEESPVPAPSSVTEPIAQETTTPETTTPEITTPEITTPEPVTEVDAPSSGVQVAGTACAEEGTWNCIAGTQFQQCASGTWSQAQSLAPGTQCAAGISRTFSVTALSS